MAGPTRSSRDECFAGARAELPVLLGVLPFGLIYGVLAVRAGLSPAAAIATSSVIFAGSAQFAAAQLIGAGAPGAIIIASGIVINLRHLLYSASLLPYLRHLSPLWKWTLAYLLTDEAYVVAITRYRRANPSAAPGSSMHWYFLGAGLALWATWQATTLAGVLFGARVPERWGLDFALPLTFIALLVPAIRGRSDLVAAVAAGLIATLAAGAPFKLGLVVGAVGGMAAGLAVLSFGGLAGTSSDLRADRR